LEEVVMARILDVEGIGSKYTKKLHEVGIRSTTRLLNIGATKRGREDLAKHTGISEILILEWVNLADLMRIKGIGEEYSDLLEEVGVDTVKELRNRVPDNLYDALVVENQDKALVRRLPSRHQVNLWIAQAKILPPKITY
jgi:predicted flap endonuclease-1-like 5' DNA nuclease